MREWSTLATAGQSRSKSKAIITRARSNLFRAQPQVLAESFETFLRWGRVRSFAWIPYVSGRSRMEIRKSQRTGGSLLAWFQASRITEIAWSFRQLGARFI